MRVETGPRIHQAQRRTRHCHRRGPRGQQEFFEQDAHYPAVGGKRESPHYHRAAFHGRKGDILGHENMGEVVKVGSEVKNLKVGDRVVVPFTIACGECFFCRDCFYSGCERTNLDHEKAAELWGNSPAGLFGYFHPPKHQSPGVNDELFIIHVELVETNPFPIWSY